MTYDHAADTSLRALRDIKKLQPSLEPHWYTLEDGGISVEVEVGRKELTLVFPPNDGPCFFVRDYVGKVDKTGIYLRDELAGHLLWLLHNPQHIQKKEEF